MRKDGSRRTTSSRARALTTVALALSAALLSGAGCTVRGRVGVPVVVRLPPPQRSPPPQPAYYAPAAAPPPPQYAQPQAPCIDPGDRDLPDLFDSPTPIDANSSTTGCTYRGDSDLFVITVPPGAGGQLVRYSLRGQAEMAPTLEIYNANRKRLDRATIGSRQELVGWALVAGGTHVFARIGQLHGVNEAYTLTLQTAPLGDSTEPNDTAEQATLLRPGTALSGYMGNPANNEAAVSDWYRIDVPRDGVIAVDLDMSQGIATNALLYDAFSRRLIRQQMGSRGERFLLQAPVRRGTYHLHVKSTHRVEEAGSGALPPALTRPYRISIAP